MRKPITVNRPWWRNPKLPWGWVALGKDVVGEQALGRNMTVTIDGYNRPGDAGKGLRFVYVPKGGQDDA